MKKIILSLMLIYSLYLIGDYSQLIDYYESSNIQTNKSIDFISILKKKLNIKDEMKGFDINSYCFRKKNNWKWKPLFIIYNSLIEQHEYLDSQLNGLINNLAKINKNVTLQDIKNFKIEFNQRTE
jgi:uncharacterized protein YdcH (DUF465 family)